MASLKLGFILIKKKDRANHFLYLQMVLRVPEVSIDRFTGELKVLRTDIIMDLGRPINEGIDYGQVCGAFVKEWGGRVLRSLLF